MILHFKQTAIGTWVSLRPRSEPDDRIKERCTRRLSWEAIVSLTARTYYKCLFFYLHEPLIRLPLPPPLCGSVSASFLLLIWRVLHARTLCYLPPPPRLRLAGPRFCASSCSATFVVAAASVAVAVDVREVRNEAWCHDIDCYTQPLSAFPSRYVIIQERALTMQKNQTILQDSLQD